MNYIYLQLNNEKDLLECFEVKNQNDSKNCSKKFCVSQKDLHRHKFEPFRYNTQPHIDDSPIQKINNITVYDSDMNKIYVMKDIYTDVLINTVTTVQFSVNFAAIRYEHNKPEQEIIVNDVEIDENENKTQTIYTVVDTEFNLMLI